MNDSGFEVVNRRSITSANSLFHGTVDYAFVYLVGVVSNLFISRLLSIFGYCLLLLPTSFQTPICFCDEVMFSSENFSLNYHHKPKNSVTNGFSNQTIPNKPFQTFNSNNLDKMNRSLSGKPNACFDSQIANLWKTGNNEPCVMTAEDIWKFCPINNSGTDYSSLSSASQSPEDHTETFFNVASQVSYFRLIGRGCETVTFLEFFKDNDNDIAVINCSFAPYIFRPCDLIAIDCNV